MINLSRLGVFATLILASSLFFITAAAADSCDTDPERCTPAKLCEKTTETLDEVLYWISDESNAFLKTARKFGLDCKAKDPLSPCERNADLCSIVELCEIATSEIENNILWDTKRYEHVSLAKEFGLQCDVNDLSTQNLTDVAFVNCNANISQCSDVDICLTATFQSAGTTSWRFGGYKKFVDEAKRRGLSCDVIKPNSPENVGVLDNTKILPKKRTDPNRLIFDIVKAADNGETCQLTVNVTNNTSYDFDYISSRLRYMDKYGAEINRVLLDGKEIVAGDYVQWRSMLSKPCADINSASLGEVVYVKVDGKFNFQLPKIISKQQILYSSVPSLTVNRTTDGFNVKKPNIKSTSKTSLRCDEDISNCSDVYLCLAATFKSSGTTKWKTSSDASKFIDEAKRRGISCGVASTSSVDAPNSVSKKTESSPQPIKSNAQKLHENNDPISHFKLIQLALAGDDPEAMYFLSLSFRNGIGTDKDLWLARHWLNRSAEAGFTTAQYELAENLRLGQNNEEFDIEAAKKWYSKAAKQGDTRSSTMLLKIETEQKEMLKKREQSGPWTGDIGYILINGRKYSYLDIEFMDWTDFVGKDATIYGYFRSFSESNKPGFGYYISQFYDGENKKENFPVEIFYEVFHRPSETISSAKKRAYLPLRKADTRSGSVSYMLKMKGVFLLYSNLDKVYFQPREIDLIPEFEQ